MTLVIRDQKHYVNVVLLPLCPSPQGINTASQNPSWISFVAVSKQMILTTIASECTDPAGQAKGGVQFILYKNCPATPVDVVQCDFGNDVCNGDGIRNIFYDNLEIGKKYYLLMDGCTGSSCKIRLQSNFCDSNLIAGKKNIVKIDGTLWSEYNGNSIIDNADKGVENIKMFLLSGSGEIIDSTQNDKSGDYLFPGHEEGCYFISLKDNFFPYKPLRYLVTWDNFYNISNRDNDNNLFLSNQPLVKPGTQLLSFIYPDDLSDTIIDMTTDFCLKLTCTQPNTSAKSFANQTTISCKFTDFNGPICSALKPIGNNQQTIKYKQKDITLYNPDFFSFVPDGRNFVFAISNNGCVVGERCALEYFEKYLWIDCRNNGATFETLDSVFIPPYSVDFKIIGFKGDCKWELDCTPIMTSTKDINTPQINIFPNPSYNEAVIITSINSEIINVQLFSIDGKKNVLSNITRDKDRWELKNIDRGLYIVQVVTSSGTINRLLKMF